MKYVSILLLVLGFMGCSSAKKVDTPATSKAAAAPTVVQKPTAKSDGQKLTCTKGKDARVLEVVKKDKGCALNYTKAGKESAVASSVNGTKHCEDSQKKVSAKLEQAGFQCK